MVSSGSTAIGSSDPRAAGNEPFIAAGDGADVPKCATVRLENACLSASSVGEDGLEMTQ